MSLYRGNPFTSGNPNWCEESATTRPPMRVKKYLIQFKDTDSSLSFIGDALYTKGGFACISYTNVEGVRRVKRWPLVSIHSIDCEY